MIITTKSKNRGLAILIVLLFLPGCTYRYVDVDSYALSGEVFPREVPYAILPANSLTTDLAYIEYSQLVESELVKRGIKVIPPESASAGMIIDYQEENLSRRRFRAQVVDLVLLRAKGVAKQLWKVDAITSDSTELRLLMPMLVEASFLHLGEDTHGPIRHIFHHKLCPSGVCP